MTDRFSADLGHRQHEVRLILDETMKTVKEALEAADIEMPASLVASQATPSFKVAAQEGAVAPECGVGKRPTGGNSPTVLI